MTVKVIIVSVNEVSTFEISLLQCYQGLINTNLKACNRIENANLLATDIYELRVCACVCVCVCVCGV